MINIYCDESSHLENDQNDAMLLGCISCSKESAAKINRELREIKHSHGISGETKWVKVGKGKIQYYYDAISYFFSNPELSFRCIIATGKNELNHDFFNQTYDEWYYKMYYLLLDKVTDVSNEYKIYVDKKEAHGGPKVAKLKDILNHSLYQFYDETICGIQIVDSKEIEILQLNDLLIGAIGYTYKGLKTSISKLSIIEKIKEFSNMDLVHTTSLCEHKFNIFRWTPRRM